MKNAVLAFILLNIFTLSAQDNKPNIVLILADDLGVECINAYGGESYSTPNIDALAEKGIRFEYCNSQPVCTPSRVQIMTGKYNVRNYTRFGKLEREEVSFANILREGGYKTAIAGKWQLGKQIDAPQHFGFDTSCLWQHMHWRTDEEEHDTRYYVYFL